MRSSEELTISRECVFGFNRYQTVADNVKVMKEFASIYHLCEFILEYRHEYLAETRNLNDLDPQHNDLFQTLFSGLLVQQGEILIPETDLRVSCCFVIETLLLSC